MSCRSAAEAEGTNEEREASGSRATVSDTSAALRGL